MKEFIFYTFQGYTESPLEEPVENIQVLGFEKGRSSEEANKSLLNKRPWIIESGFDEQEIIHKQLLDNNTKDLIKALIDYNWDEEKKHYEENPVSDHIFLTLKRLKEVIE